MVSSHQFSILYIVVVYMCVCVYIYIYIYIYYIGIRPNLPVHPTLFPTLESIKFTLHICVYISALQLALFCIIYEKGKSHLCVSCSVMSNSLQPHGLQPARLLCSWDAPGKNTGVGCHALLQGIFPAQGSNSGLPHCRQIINHLSHQESP